MTENEKRLRDLFRDVRRLGVPVPSFEVGALLTAVIAERTAAARAEALEEAAEQADGGALYVRGARMTPSERIRALITTPAPASIPAPRDEDALFEAIDAEVREYRGSTGPIRVAIHAAMQSAVRSAMLEAAADHLARNRGLDVGGTATFLQNRVNGTAPASIPVEKVRAILDIAAKRCATEEGKVEIRLAASVLGVPIDNGQGDEPHAGREFIRSMGIDPDVIATTAMCACGEPRAHHDDAGRIVKFNGGNTLGLCGGFRVAP